MMFLSKNSLFVHNHVKLVVIFVLNPSLCWFMATAVKSPPFDARHVANACCFQLRITSDNVRRVSELSLEACFRVHIRIRRTWDAEPTMTFHHVFTAQKKNTMDHRESDSSVVHGYPKKPWIPAGLVAYEGCFMGFNGTEAAKTGDIHGIFMAYSWNFTSKTRDI